MLGVGALTRWVWRPTWDLILIVIIIMNQRDLLNRELGHKPKRTINKPKGI
eukprot:COSAG06_NODE_50112_length_321_cov_0.445946_1_plen_50_part_10